MDASGPSLRVAVEQEDQRPVSSATSSPTPESAARVSSPEVHRPQRGHRPGPARHVDGLHLHLKKRDRLVELELAGDLDLASAGRLDAAMTWLRRRYPRTIVVDTRRLDFVDLAGYRALQSALAGPDRRRDLRTLYVVGDVVARLQHHLALATAIDAHPSTPQLSGPQSCNGRSTPTS
jgi:anti-anti-sigma factor